MSPFYFGDKLIGSISTNVFCLLVFHFGLSEKKINSICLFQDFERVILEDQANDSFAYYARMFIEAVQRNDIYELINYHHGNQFANSLIQNSLKTLIEFDPSKCNLKDSFQLNDTGIYWSKGKLLQKYKQYLAIEKNLCENDKISLANFRDSWAVRRRYHP